MGSFTYGWDQSSDLQKTGDGSAPPPISASGGAIGSQVGSQMAGQGAGITPSWGPTWTMTGGGFDSSGGKPQQGMWGAGLEQGMEQLQYQQCQYRQPGLFELPRLQDGQQPGQGR